MVTGQRQLKKNHRSCSLLGVAEGGSVRRYAHRSRMSASVILVNDGYGKAGKKLEPSGRSPWRRARMKSASVQLPIPAVLSGVMFGPKKVPKGVFNPRPPAKGTAPSLSSV